MYDFGRESSAHGNVVEIISAIIIKAIISLFGIVSNSKSRIRNQPDPIIYIFGKHRAKCIKLIIMRTNAISIF